MKNVIFYLAAFLISGVCGAQSSQIAKKLEFTDSFSITGISKDILFNRASMWIHENFRVQDTKIKIQDKPSGVIFGDITIYSKEKSFPVTFSLALNLTDGRCFYLFNNYNNNAGNLNNSNPDCCYSAKQWKGIKLWSNSESRRLIASLKEKLGSKSPAEDFLTIPLTDTTVQTRKNEASPQVHSQPVSFNFAVGGAYAPGIFTTGTGSSGFRHGGSFGGGGQNPTGEPFPMFHATCGIFIPNKLNPTHGFGIDAGFFVFSLPLKQTITSYSTGTAQPETVTNSTGNSGLEFFPHYTLLSKKKRNFKRFTSFGLDIALSSATTISDMAGLKAEYGMGRNGFYLSAWGNLTLNNIYGTGRGQQLTIIKPMFIGLNLSFYPSQNGWLRKVFK